MKPFKPNLHEMDEYEQASYAVVRLMKAVAPELDEGLAYPIVLDFMCYGIDESSIQGTVEALQAAQFRNRN